MPQGTTVVSYISGIKKAGRPIQNCMGCSQAYDLSSIGSLDHDSAIGWMKAAPDPTDPNSIPNTGFWDHDWTCQQWQIWHAAMKTAWGQEVANQRFIQYASQVSDWSSDHFCPYEASFANYFKDQGIDFDNFVASTVVTTTNVVNNLGQTATNTTAVLKWLLPVGVVLVAAGGLMYLKQTYLDKPAVRGLKRVSHAR